MIPKHMHNVQNMTKIQIIVEIKWYIILNKDKTVVSYYYIIYYEIPSRLRIGDYDKAGKVTQEPVCGQFP